MAAALVLVSGALVLDFLYVLWRASREWRLSDELSTTTGLFITGLYALVAALGVLAVVGRPWPIDLPQAVAVTVGGVVAFAGIALAAPGYGPFASVKHLYGVEHGGLITDGIYRYSRNPQYTGIGIALAGAAVAARSGVALALAAAYFAGVRLWLFVEEAHLHRLFGPDYAAYRRRVPRFLGVRGRRGSGAGERPSTPGQG